MNAPAATPVTVSLKATVKVAGEAEPEPPVTATVGAVVSATVVTVKVAEFAPPAVAAPA